jgi:hypothetical protein
MKNLRSKSLPAVFKHDTLKDSSARFLASIFFSGSTLHWPQISRLKRLQLFSCLCEVIQMLRRFSTVGYSGDFLKMLDYSKNNVVTEQIVEPASS